MLNRLKILKMNKILFFSFGYPPTATTVTSGVTHLQNQVYDICFRRASGYCYICYVSYFCNLIWWLTFWTLIIPICAPSKTVKGKRKKKNKKKEESFDWKVRRGITKLHRPKVLPSSPWKDTRVGLPGKNSGIQTMVTNLWKNSLDTILENILGWTLRMKFLEKSLGYIRG